MKQRLYTIFENIPNSLVLSLFIVSFVSGVRFLGEWLILDGQKYFTYGGLPHHFAFYLAMLVINVNNISLLLKKDWSQCYGIVGIGLLLGILPLFIDAAIINTVSQKYHYFNEFHPLLFSDKQPLGESITLWILMAGFSFYIFLASSSWITTLLGAVVMYLTIQFGGWASTVCLDYLIQLTGLKAPSDHLWTLWWLLIAFVITVVRNRHQFKTSFSRIHHTFIWGALVLVGAKLVGFIDGVSILRALIMSLSFLFVMLINDYFDKETDRHNLRESGITLDMVFFVLYCYMVLVLTAGDLDLALGVVAFLCFILGLAYSVPGIFRLKKNFVLSSMVEGIGATLCLLVGGTQFGPPLSQWFLPLILLSGLAFMLASNMKDYKDFKGDLNSGILTLYVYLYRRGWALRQINFRISLFLALMLLGPCLLLLILDVHPGLIAAAVVLALLPSSFMIKLPSPESAVKYGLISITGYFLFLAWVLPRLPI